MYEFALLFSGTRRSLGPQILAFMEEQEDSFTGIVLSTTSFHEDSFIVLLEYYLLSLTLPVT